VREARFGGVGQAVFLRDGLASAEGLVGASV
jgi:hypothetical protein